MEGYNHEGWDAMDIDDVDFSILNVIATDQFPLWKKEIHRNLSTDPHALPNVREVSVQTVGRRVDDLHERGYLDSCIISPKDINRDLIIAFKITDAGEQVRAEKRERLLREYVYHTFSKGNPDATRDVDTLAALTVEELGIDQELYEELRTADSLDLLTLLLLHYTRSELSDRMTGEDLDRLADLATVDDRLDTILSEDFLASCNVEGRQEAE